MPTSSMQLNNGKTEVIKVSELAEFFARCINWSARLGWRRMTQKSKLNESTFSDEFGAFLKRVNKG